ncbi:MAG: hypothetical protein MUF02_06205, partial [Acidobacteria bacterium]|nr:hypothetical protein [Acidobacteriota bacterium]
MKKQLHLIPKTLVLLFLAGALYSQSPGIKKIKLGPEINSPAREIGPLISADGQTLYFTREWYVDDDIRSDMKSRMGLGKNDQAIQDMLNNPALDEKTKATLRQALVPPTDEQLV